MATLERKPSYPKSLTTKKEKAETQGCHAHDANPRTQP